MKGYINTINIDEDFPRRRDFADEKIKCQIDKNIKNNKPVDFITTSTSESLPFEPYTLFLHGALLSGDKATVAVKGIKLFFDIRVPDGMSATIFKGKIKSALAKQNIYTKSIDSHQAIGPIGFNRVGTYMRLYFIKLMDRKKAIQYYDSNKYTHKNEEKRYETSYDDLSCYYRKACREHKFSMVDWNTIVDYKRETVRGKTSLADYVFHCNVNDIRWNDIDKTSDDNKAYAKPKTMVCAFDLETHSYRAGGDVPKPEHDLDEIFMVGLTFHWEGEAKPFLKVGICTQPMEQGDYLVINCKSEKELLLAFFRVIGQMMPDFIIEFNGGQYDWPWVLHRTNKYHLIPYMTKHMCLMRDRIPDANTVKKWNIKKRFVKLEADTKTECINLNFPGFECIDVRIKFRQLFSKAESSSLSFFLELCGLDSKLDMPYEEMFRRFKRSDMDPVDYKKYLKKKLKKKKITKEDIKKSNKTRLREMREVMDYCIIDSIRCQELLLAKSMISDMREVGVRSFTSMSDCINLADGMKVKNLILNVGISRNLQFSSISHPSEKFKYPGAYVVEPEAGLENERPVTGLDFSSLYPSLIRAYNLSPEYTVFTREEMERLKKEGHSIHHICFPGPNGTTIEGWTVRHDNKEEKIGIYPYILGYLFDERSKMKKIMKPFGSKLEEMDKEGKADTGEFADIKLKFDYINAKQKALKVFMNTFYGLMGDVTSPLFLLLLAGGTTSSGQYNIKMVAKYVVSRGYRIKYGDTDSLYIVPPDSVFKDVDRLYKKKKITKLEYWTQMVELTMKDLNTFKDEVNNMLKLDNGTVYLKMAYEEVLFPFVSLAKKIYYGIAHEEIVNFTPKKLFIRGMAPIKRGVPDFIKKLDMEIMWESVSINNTKTLRELTENKLKEIPDRDWTLEDFVQTAVFRPLKDQKTLKAFVETLPEKNRPKPGRRFSYLVVEQNPYYTDLEGRKKTKKKGEMMAYYDYAKEHNLKPNMMFYMQGISGSGGMVVGQFARFVSYDKQFDAETDKKRMDIAKKYIKTLCTQYTQGFQSNAKACKYIYKQTHTAVMKKCERIYGDASTILGKLKHTKNKNEMLEKIEKEVLAKGKTKGFKESVYNAAHNLCTSYNPYELFGLYVSGPNNIYRTRKIYTSKILNRYMDELEDIIPKLTKLSDIQTKAVEDIVTELRNKLDVENDDKVTIESYGSLSFQKLLNKRLGQVDIPEGYKKDLIRLEKIFDQIKSLKIYDEWNDQLIGYIKYFRQCKAGNPDPTFKVEESKKEEITEIAKSLYTLPVF